MNTKIIAYHSYHVLNDFYTQGHYTCIELGIKKPEARPKTMISTGATEAKNVKAGFGDPKINAFGFRQ